MHRILFILRIILPLLILLSFLGTINAQETARTKGELQNKLAKFESTYNKRSLLTNGIVYLDVYRTYLGSPFLWHPQGSQATIYFHGRKYTNQDILLDIFNQDLILESRDQFGAKIKLKIFNELIDSLVLDEKTFIYNTNTSCFYEIFAKNECSLFLRLHQKDLQISKSELNHEFKTLKPKLFLQRNDSIYRIHNKRDFLKLIPNSKHVIAKKILHQSKFHPKRPEYQSAQILLNSLSPLLCN